MDNIKDSGRFGNAIWSISDNTLFIDGSLGTIEWAEEYPWSYACNDIQHIVIAEGTKNVPNYAFVDFASLIDVLFPRSLLTIGDESFKRCTSLCDVDFAGGIRSIGHNAFLECSSLEEIYFPMSLQNIGPCAFESGGLKGEIDLPSYAFIDENAFSNCDIEILHMNYNYTAMDAFLRCENLRTIYADHCMINRWTFSDCQALNELVSKNSIYAECAFNHCESMEKVSFEHDVVQSEAFHCCENIKEIIANDRTTLPIDAFDDYCQTLIEKGELEIQDPKKMEPHR